MQDHRKVFQILIVLLALIITSCEAQNLTSGQEVGISGERTALPSFTQSMGDTPDKTVTPQTASASLPAVRKTPGVLECADIVRTHSESTDVEWEGAKMLLRGSEIYYTGSVFSVTENDEVHLSGSLCHATLHHVPHDIAVTLSHGQFIEGYGTIASIGFNRGEDVDIEVNPDLLFVR